MTDPTADDQSLMAPLRQALLDCAAAGATITYQELAQRASFPGPHTIHRLTLLLEAMAREDHAAGRPLLAALAVSRTQKGPDGGGIPGRGFFQLLPRSEERRVGNECVRTCSYRWSPYPAKKKNSVKHNKKRPR